MAGYREATEGEGEREDRDGLLWRGGKLLGSLAHDREGSFFIGVFCRKIFFPGDRLGIQFRREGGTSLESDGEGAV